MMTWMTLPNHRATSLVPGTHGVAPTQIDTQFSKNLPNQKKKKKEEKKPVQPSRKTNNKDKGLGTPIEIAKAYVAEVSIDIGLQVVIASLIWGDTDGSSDTDLLTLATTSENSAHCWSRYKPLLVILCKAWPGFLTMLLKEIVEYVLSTSGNVEGAKKELRPSILLCWFQFLLSKEFMIYMGLVPDEQDLMKKKQSEWTSQEKKEMGNPIPYEKLPNLPLENLYEKLMEEEDKTNETALQIQSLLGQVLGHSATVVGPSLKTKQAEISGAGNRDNSALDQERPLANSKCLWERVENWKPCDIGSLPSCPNSL